MSSRNRFWRRFEKKIDYTIVLNEIQEEFFNKFFGVLTVLTVAIFTGIHRYCIRHLPSDDVYDRLVLIIKIALNLPFQLPIFSPDKSCIYYENFFLSNTNRRVVEDLIFENIKDNPLLKDVSVEDIIDYCDIFYRILYDLVHHQSLKKVFVGVNDLRSIQRKNINLSHETAEIRNFVRCQILVTIKNNPTLSNIKIAELFSVHRKTVANVRNKYLTNPKIKAEDLVEKSRGPKPSDDNLVNSKVLNELIKALIEEDPKKHGLNYSTWTGNCVIEYLEKVYDIKVTRDYIYNLFRKHGIRSKYASRQNPNRKDEAKQKFLHKTYREICQEAKKDGFRVIYCDETSCLKGQHNRGFAPCGISPSNFHTTESAHTAATLLTFLGVDGFFQLFSIEQTMNAAMFFICLMILHLTYPDEKFMLIMDNSHVHTARMINNWILESKEISSFLRLRWLPAYCPELNPVEYFNNVFKGYLRNLPLKNKQDIISATENFCLDFISGNQQNIQQRVVSFFKAEECKYSFEIYNEIFNEINTEVA